MDQDHPQQFQPAPFPPTQFPAAPVATPDQPAERKKRGPRRTKVAAEGEPRPAQQPRKPRQAPARRAGAPKRPRRNTARPAKRPKAIASKRVDFDSMIDIFGGLQPQDSRALKDISALLEALDKAGRTRVFAALSKIFA